LREIKALVGRFRISGADPQGIKAEAAERPLGLFRSRKPVQVIVGSRYRVGDSPLLVWEVANLFQGIDGTPYAHIFCLADPSRRKTVAQNALEAGNQYVRVPDAHAQ
jgi:hypothetical protein